MYPYEDLDPERFQQFCQALLVLEFPNIQCFPVGQRDGGRDAISRVLDPGKSFCVFQVKFVRNQSAGFDPHEWLARVVSEEVPKVRSLIPRGASHFHFITNVRGTAFPESGSIDELNAALTDLIPVPSQAWWRDDLDRRLDAAWDLKWTYPELMRGPDLIRAVVEAGAKEHHERRSAAIKAFLRDQYERDQEVRFKQVELQNKLLDLFIDVPVSPREHFTNRKQLMAFSRSWRSILHDSATPAEQESLFEPHISAGREERTTGAATFLLHPITQRRVRKVVIEGAPGQGKSTIGQYVCQVHRMRLLNKSFDLSQVAPQHSASPIRLPFKIDLRDLSAWLNKIDPFAADEAGGVPAQWSKNLESFLAAQVRHHSGGTDFSVDDLLAVSKLSALLLVFDGLDEVADISRRQEVVAEIVRAVSRIEENAASVQAVVTSRPAAFANSPGLPEGAFHHFHLDSVTPLLIQQYADKWLKARRLYGRESAEVRRILKEKMDQPHLRDLARNPMQLAILLSLIHRRGSSLPDKRTALYDNYIDLFFSREAEKSATVREHRELLIDLHRYVAWLLHTESEKGGTHTGSISVERLQRVLTEYLKSEGHDTSLVQELFHGMVERVIALVSRVQGTLEFEVQPLREYFAARYLYETAPYSPPGDERKGTKPDRFDAISRNFYWLNVCRFYAGCFSKGELASLVDRLQDLAKDADFGRLSHPRTLAAILLSDWVFSQYPKSVAEVVALAADSLGLRSMVPSPARRIGSGPALVLPKRNGNEELVGKCFSILRSNPPRDFASDVIEVIKANSSPAEALEMWSGEIERAAVGNRFRWFDYGFHMGVLALVTPAVLEHLMSDSPLDPQRLELIHRARHFGFIESSEERMRVVADLILLGSIRGRQGPSVLEFFTFALQPERYIEPNAPREASVADLWESATKQLSSADMGGGESVTLGKCLKVIETFKLVSEKTLLEWSTEIGPWNDLVEKVRSLFGDRWQLFVLANVAAGIRSTGDSCTEAQDLLDIDIPLCRRVRYARLRAGTAPWWVRQFLRAADIGQQCFAALVALTWASASTIDELAPVLSRILDRLPESDWRRLAHSIRIGVVYGRPERRSSVSWLISSRLTRSNTPGLW